ncbi:response regulator transcription factor [Streptomyces sp. Amel2xC10]|uniref:response regulator transcription factor n=1 Tax=Streptomyces sp. Amel2xC10 TaxID=1305826 RepID=UPI000A089D9A|nr:response regulator transcription factor [Streptomyces sp. Amel2xC10]SMF76945.1 two-component system, OmpR family, KDP operon response regulator KdpE [Streptomyces sp. Amel2xC10]
MVNPTRVLVVDDEPQTLRALVINLRARGYEVDTAPDGVTALELAAAHRPDAVVLDLGLPDMDGVEAIKELRHRTRAPILTRVPILALSARHSAAERAESLAAGADAYVTKPFDLDALLARLRDAVREAAVERDVVVEAGGFTVDLAAGKVHRAGQDVRLTPTEWRLLEVLVRNAGRPVGRRHLLQTVWGPSYGTESNYLRVYMAQLRRKLEADPSRPAHLITEPGTGYRFER